MRALSRCLRWALRRRGNCDWAESENELFREHRTTCGIRRYTVMITMNMNSIKYCSFSSQTPRNPKWVCQYSIPKHFHMRSKPAIPPVSINARNATENPNRYAKAKTRHDMTLGHRPRLQILILAVLRMICLQQRLANTICRQYNKGPGMRTKWDKRYSRYFFQPSR
jgi:hypothetical protein